MSKLYFETWKTASSYIVSGTCQLSLWEDLWIDMSTYTLGIWDGLSSSWSRDEVPATTSISSLVANMMINGSTSTYSGVNASPDEANAKEAINHLAAAIVNGAKLIASSSLLICVIQEPEDQERFWNCHWKGKKRGREKKPPAVRLPFISFRKLAPVRQVNQINIPLLVLQSLSLAHVLRASVAFSVSSFSIICFFSSNSKVAPVFL